MITSIFKKVPNLKHFYLFIHGVTTQEMPSLSLTPIDYTNDQNTACTIVTLGYIYILMIKICISGKSSELPYLQCQTRNIYEIGRDLNFFE